jgi:hypothetical protein
MVEGLKALVFSVYMAIGREKKTFLMVCPALQFRFQKLNIPAAGPHGRAGKIKKINQKATTGAHPGFLFRIQDPDFFHRGSRIRFRNIGAEPDPCN